MVSIPICIVARLKRDWLDQIHEYFDLATVQGLSARGSFRAPHEEEAVRSRPQRHCDWLIPRPTP